MVKLFNNENYLAMVDGFNARLVNQYLEKYLTRYALLKKQSETYHSLVKRIDEFNKNQEAYEYAYNEIKALNLKEGEEEEIASEIALLENYDKIYSLLMESKELMDGEEFETCGYTIKCIATPFHTRGSAVFLVDEENAMFSGDTLFYTTVGRVDLASSAPRLMSSSLLKLVKLEKNYTVYPGHGPKTTLEREKKYNSYLRNI